MREISAAFLAVMETQPCIARIVLDDTDIIQGDPIQEINFTGGTNGDADAVSVGGVVAASVEILLDKSLVTVPIVGRSMAVSLGIELNGEMEWVEMGTYKASNPTQDDGTITVQGFDPIGEHFDAEFEPIEGFDFESDDGVSSLALAAAICSRHGVTADLSGLEDHTLKDFSPEGCTDRKILGFIAALYGKFVNIGRDGILRFRWYNYVDVTISGDNYYEDSLERGVYDFAVRWLKCYNEVLEETLVAGDPDAEQGIYFACPWMTQELLETLFESLGGFTYAPVSELEFFGDPRLEPGDIIRLVDLEGIVYRVPIMTLTNEFDGGLRTSISSVGQVKTDVYEGPVERETKRTVAKIVKKTNAIEMSVESAQNEISHLQLNAEEIAARVQDTEGNISELQQQAEELSAEVENAVGQVASMQIRADEIESQVQGFGEEVTQIKQTAGQVSVEAEDEDGKLSTQINPTEWTAERTDKDGNVVSGFRFDFGVGQFVFDGTGKFMSADGKSYITVSGTDFILYAKQGEDGDFVDIARIGFSEDSEGMDYPYVLLGHEDADSSNFAQLGLLKMFSNGIYLGNSAPKGSTGAFSGLEGASGIQDVVTAYAAAPLVNDGLAGPATMAATAAYQNAVGLPSTGIADDLTRAMILDTAVPEPGREEDPDSWWDEIEYFTREELKCKCGGRYCNGFPAEPQELTVRLADRARKHFGAPAYNVSFLRCPQHNANSGGVPNSQHMYGEAMDIRISGVSADELLRFFLAQPEVRYTYKINATNVHFDIPKGAR